MPSGFALIRRFKSSRSISAEMTAIRKMVGLLPGQILEPPGEIFQLFVVPCNSHGTDNVGNLSLPGSLELDSEISQNGLFDQGQGHFPRQGKRPEIRASPIRRQDMGVLLHSPLQGIQGETVTQFR